jgi:hypothetical protein
VGPGFLPGRKDVAVDASGRQALWICNAWLDVVVGCGAWSAPLLWLAYGSLASNTLKWSLAFYALALFY